MDIFSIDFSSIIRLFLCFSLNIVTVWVFIHFIYGRFNSNRDFPFTYMVFNILIFFSCSVMSSMDMKMGFAFGLFAIFGILRYRTIQVPIKEMTYLLGVIVIAVINALMNKAPDLKDSGEVVTAAIISNKSLIEMAIINACILLATYLLERIYFGNKEQYIMINYEKIELIHTARKQDLFDDLNLRLGYKVTRVDIESIDLLKDMAICKVYYIPDNQVIK